MGLVAEFVASQNARDEFDACNKAVKRHFDVELAGKVNPHQLAANKKIPVSRESNTPYEGMIERDTCGNARIVLRAGINRQRERFTLAHELGHWILQEEMLGTTDGRLFRGLSRCSAEVNEEERLASLLAAEILMPFHALRIKFSEKSPLQSLNEICRDFSVSRIAAIRRIADVCSKNILLVQIVPYRFHDFTSVAEVDDAVFATSRQTTLFDRDRTRLRKKLRFEEFFGVSRIDLSLSTPKGTITAAFDTEIRSNPIPHVFALAVMEEWDRNKRDVEKHRVTALGSGEIPESLF